MLEIRQRPELSWLIPLRKYGVPIARTVLVRQAAGDRYTLRFVCELVPDALEEVGTQPSVTHGVNLFASVCSGVLAENTAEASVAAILPFILSGMTSGNVDLKAATYLLVCQLAAVATLEPHLCNALVDAVGKSVETPLVNEALLALVLLCQTQTVAALPAGAATRAIVSLDALPSHLADISRKYNASAFVGLVVKAMFADAVANAVDLPPLLDVLQEVKLGDALAFRVGNMVVKAYTEVRGVQQKPNKKIPSALKKAVGHVLAGIETAYPAAMDRLMAETLAPTSSSFSSSSSSAMMDDGSDDGSDDDDDDGDGEGAAAAVAGEVASEIVQLMGSGGARRHRKAAGEHLSLFLSLQHAEPTVRAAAVKQLRDTLPGDSDQVESADRSFFREALEARLLDTDTTVAKNTLDLGSKLVDFIEPATLFSALTALMQQTAVAKRSPKFFKRAVNVLCGPFLANADADASTVRQVELAVLPYLLASPSTAKCAVVALEAVAGSATFQHDKTSMFAGLAKLVKASKWTAAALEDDEMTMLDANKAVLAAIAANLAGPAAAAAGVADALFAAAAASDACSRLRQAAWLLATEMVGQLGGGKKKKEAAATKAAALADTLIGLVTPALLYGAANQVQEAKADADTPASEQRNAIVAATQRVYESRGACNPVLVAKLALQHVRHLFDVLPPVTADMFVQAAGPAPKPAAVVAVGLATKMFVLAASALQPQSYAAAIQAFFTAVVPQCPLEFLSHCWSSAGGAVPTLVRVRSLQFADAYMQSSAFGSDDATTLPTLLHLIPHLLHAVLSDVHPVRAAAMTCLANVASVLAGQTTSAAKGAGGRGGAKPKQQKLEVSADHLKWLLSRMAVAQTELVANNQAFSQLLKAASDAAPKAKSAYGEVVLCFLVKSALESAYPAVTASLLSATEANVSAAKLDMLWPQVTEIVKAKEQLAAKFSVVRAALFSVSEQTAGFFSSKPARLEPLLSALAADGAGSGTGETNARVLVLQRMRDTGFVDALPKKLRRQVFVALCDLLTRHGGHAIAPLLRNVLGKIQLDADDIVSDMERRLQADAPAAKGKKGTAAAAAAAKAAAAEAEAEAEADAKKRRRLAAAADSSDDDDDGGMDQDAAHEDDEDDDAKIEKADAADVQRIRRTAVLLEVLQFKDLMTIKSRADLLSPMFGLLELCMSLGASAQPAIENIKQMILENLLTLCENTGAAPMKEEYFNTELIVQCIKTSSSPQTHHYALLLLAGIAAIHPPKVLRAIMPIFTFMGSSMLKQDDNQSFYVIERTIKTVVPAILSSASDGDDDNMEVVVAILGVFVDALKHIPKHRCLPLFTYLLRTLGANQHLHVVLALLVKRVILDTRTSKQQQAASDQAFEGEPQLFPLAVATQFSVMDQMQAIEKLFELLAALPKQAAAAEAASQKKKSKKSKKKGRNGMDVDADADSDPTFALLFNTADHTPKQLRHFTYRIVCHLSSNLTSASFLRPLQELEQSGTTSEEVLELLRDKRFTILESALSFVLQLKSLSGSDRGSSKFHSTLTEHAYGIVDQLNALFSVGDFVGVVKQLLGHPDATIRQKAIVLFTERVAEGARNGSLDAADVELYLDATPDLIVLARGSRHPEGHADHTDPSLCQAALYALTILIVHFGRDHRASFSNLLETAVALLQSPALQAVPEVLASCVSCIGALVVALGPAFIPSLPAVVPCLLKRVDGDAAALPPLLQGSIISAISALVKSVPQFLGPYLKNILHFLTAASFGAEAADGAGAAGVAQYRGAINQKAFAVRQAVAKSVPARVLLPPLYACYTAVASTASSAGGVPASIVMLMDLLRASIEEMSRADINLHYKQIFKFFLSALDCRGILASDDDAEARATEGSVVSALVQMILKLSETSFLPLLLKLLDWSTRADVPARRQVTLFRTVDMLAGELKSLFIGYYSYFLKHFVAALNADDDEEAAGGSAAVFGDFGHLAPEAKRYIQTALRVGFLNDDGSFVTKERFKVLQTPLVHQLNIRADEGPAEYYARVEEEVLPCLGALPTTMKVPSLLKDLNREVLLKLQASSAEVRKGGVIVLGEFYRLHGDSFLQFLPETVPLLVELLEDDSEDVEKETQELVRNIEGVLGESISSYF